MKVQSKDEKPLLKQASESTVTNPKGTKLFQGYSVMHLSKKPESGFVGFLHNLKKFAKFYWDPAYKEKKRNEFLEKAKLEIMGIKPMSNEDIGLERAKLLIRGENPMLNEDIGLENEIKARRETIKNIMEISDSIMLESKKKELILFTIDNSSNEVVKKKLENDKIILDAEQFFEKKNSAMRVKIRQLASSAFKELKESESYQGLFDKQSTIRSQEDLNTDKMALIQTVIELLQKQNIRPSELKQFAQKLIDDPELNFSEKEKISIICLIYKGNEKEIKALLEEVAQRDIPEREKIQLMLYAIKYSGINRIEIEIEGKHIKLPDYYAEKTKEAINKMALATAPASQNEAILSMLNKKYQEAQNKNIETFEQFQEKYLQEVIQAMTKLYKDKPSAVDVLEKNVIELLKFEPVIVLSREEKRELIASVKPTEGKNEDRIRV